MQEQHFYNVERDYQSACVSYFLCSEQITNQATLLRTNMYATIKYESLYMLNIMDSFDSLATFQKSYQDKKNELMKKKQKLFEEGNVSKWNLKDSSIDKSNKE